VGGRAEIEVCEHILQFRGCLRNAGKVLKFSIRSSGVLKVFAAEACGGSTLEAFEFQCAVLEICIC